MPRLTFRAADLSDLPALVALVESAYRGDSSRQGWTTEADLLQGPRLDPDVLQADIEREGSVVVLGTDADGTLTACAHVTRTGDGTGYFGMFAVRPGTQGQGLGKEVLAEAERVLRDDLGVRTVEMTVIDVRTELLAFYERRGYVRTGEHRPFPGTDEQARGRAEALRMSVLSKELVAP